MCVYLIFRICQQTITNSTSTFYIGMMKSYACFRKLNKWCYYYNFVCKKWKLWNNLFFSDNTQPFDELVEKLISIRRQCFLLNCQLMHPADQRKQIHSISWYRTRNKWIYYWVFCASKSRDVNEMKWKNGLLFRKDEKCDETFNGKFKKDEATERNTISAVRKNHG